MASNQHSYRPSRPLEPVASSYIPEERPSNKKPRFDTHNPSTLAPDAPEDDEFLDADEIGTKGRGTKRNAVNVDGYDSDSSNDNFDSRANEKARAEKEAKIRDAEDDDMFADLEEDFNNGDEDEDLGGKKKKDVRFINEDEIEGQVADSKSGGHVAANLTQPNKPFEDEESSSDSGGEEMRDMAFDEELGAGAKKKHAPKLDAFNMKAEGEEGKFDESGNYVRKATDPDAIHDSWLQGISKSSMKKAKEAHDKREEERRKRAREDDAVLTEDILAKLIPRLQRGETVLEALQRLNGGKKKQKKQYSWQKNKKKNGDAMDVEADPAEEAAEARRKEAIEAITGAADQLMTRGQLEIYDAERELLMRQWTKITDKNWVDPPAGEGQDPAMGEVKQWEYRWMNKRDGGKRNGPYDGPMMEAWNNAGYFSEGVEFRQVGKTGWSNFVDFV